MNTNFVRGLYKDYLNRNADDDREGLNNWTNLITTGQLTRTQARDLIAASPEAIQVGNTNFVRGLYNDYLHRNADDDKDGLKYWTNLITTGKLTKAQARDIIAGSAEAQTKAR